MNRQGLAFSPRHTHRLPTDVAVDRQDFVYIVDAMNHRVQKYTALGQPLLEFGEKSAGSNGFGDGTFNRPQQAVVMPDDHVFVTDELNNRIQEFDQNGTFLNLFGTAGSEPGQLKHPTGIAVDADERIYIADTGNNRIQVFSRQGLPLQAFGESGTVYGTFNAPTGIAVGEDGRIYVVERGNNRIQVFDTDGRFVTAFGQEGRAIGQYERPTDACFDAFTRIFVADTGNDRVQRCSATGASSIAIGESGKELGQFRGPEGVCVDTTSSFLYVADTHNDRIVKFPIRATAPIDENSPIAEIQIPHAGDFVSGSISVVGIAADAYFKTYRLEEAEGADPVEFVAISESSTPVWNGELGAWDVSGLGSGVYTLRLVVEDHAGNTSEDRVVVTVQGSTIAQAIRSFRRVEDAR